MMRGVKVFSATKARDREALGENVTRWLVEHPQLQIVDKTVTQSSDAEFHCLTITLFYDAPPERRAQPRERARGEPLRLALLTWGRAVPADRTACSSR